MNNTNEELIKGRISAIHKNNFSTLWDRSDELDVEEFDKDFQPKEKLKLPGQIFE
jgi:hypothetical protein